MASIDNRIVNMEFNNAEFERRVSDTMKTLAGLDKALAEAGKGENLKNISDSAKSFNLDGMTSAIEGVSAKFIALSTIGITALANLTNKAIDAGLQIAKSLAIQPVTQGFAEYELKMGSIQTIMASTGAPLDTVNKKLQELNTYSDRTIYSFADMTSNIGKFTNAGVDLDTAVASIQGIANVAAVSGANSEEASRAMYNFAQALSKGYVQLVDWKSIELANMGTTEFKTQLLQAAEAAGTLTKHGDEWVTKAGTVVSANKNFNDSLTDQWLTTEALNSALGDYADETTDIGKKAFASAQDIKTFSQLMDTTKEAIGSGWATTFETIIGNFEESKGLWGYIGEEIGNIVGKSADSRNQMLSTWKDMGGRVEMLLGFKAGFESFFAILRPIKEAFRDIFPAMTGERLYEITVKFHQFMEALRPSGTTVENIKRIFTGLFNVLHVGMDVIGFLIGVVKDFIVSLTGLGSGDTLGFFAKLGDALAKVSSEEIIAGIKATFGALVDLMQKLATYITPVVDKIKEFIQSLDIKMPAGFGNVIENIKTFFSGLFDNLPDASPITEVASRIGDALSNIGNAIGNALGGLNVGGAIGGVLIAVQDAFHGIIDAIAGMFSSGGELEKSVKESSDGIPWDMIMGGVGIAAVGGLVATINRLISQGITIDFTGGVLSSISDTFGQLTGTLKTMQQSIKADILLKIAGAIGVLAIAMIGLSFIDPEKLVKAAVAMGVAFGEIAAAMKIMTKIEFTTADAAKFSLMALGFGILAGGMFLLSGALALIGTMDVGTLTKGMTVFGLVVAALVVMSKTLENEAVGMIKGAVALGILAFDMDIMYGAIKKFADMDTGDMVQGFVGVALALALLVGAMALLPEDMKEKTTGVLGFSIALNLMVRAIKQLGEMDLGTLVQGGIAFAGMLGALVLAMRLMPSNMGVTAGQFLALAGAMLILSFALKVMASMSFGDMTQGLVGMAAALGILVVAMMAAQSGIVGAGAILIMSVALLALSAAIKAFAAIGLGEFAKGMLLVVVALAALAGVSLLLAPAVPALMGVGAGLALLGAGFALVGLGAIQFAKAIAILATVEDVGGVITDTLLAIGKALPALFIGIGEGIGALIEVLAGFVPQMIEFGVKLLSGLLQGLITIVPDILEFIGVLITSILDLIITLVPEFATAGIKILLGILEGIRDTLPELVTVVGEIITGFLDALAEQLPPIVGSVVNLFATMLTSVAEGLGELAPTLMFGIGIAFMTGFFDGIGNVVGQLWDLIKSIFTTVIDTVKSIFGINSPSTVMLQIGIDIIMGLYNGVIETAQKVWDFFGKLAGEVLRFIGDVTRTLVSKGSDFISGLWNGLTSFWTGTVVPFFTGLGSTVVEKVGNVVETLVTKGRNLIFGLFRGISDFWDDTVVPFFTGLKTTISNLFSGALDWLKSIGKNIIQGLLNGIKEKWNDVTSFISDAASHLPGFLKGPLGISSPSKVFMELGVNIAEGLIIGMGSLNSDLSDASRGMASSIIDSFVIEDELANAVNSAMAGIDMNPTITPVIDLTNIRAGASTIGGLLAANSYTAAGTIAKSQRYTEDSLVGAGPTEIKFEQTINAPTQLSTADIYRQTRNQITIAKEELSIA
jgi:tape measure domain-containing protein